MSDFDYALECVRIFCERAELARVTIHVGADGRVEFDLTHANMVGHSLGTVRADLHEEMASDLPNAVMHRFVEWIGK